MANAREEIARATLFEYWVVNDVLETTYAVLRAIYLAEQAKAGTCPGLLGQVLATWRE